MRLAGAHEDWVLGFEDEVWWSRRAQPALRTWSEAALQLVETAREKADTEPKALACYGLLRSDTNQMLLRFLDGRPVSSVTIAFLTWVVEKLGKDNTRVFVLVWDNASWHISHAVRTWIREHNYRVKREGGVRILECRLPSKSPWLNPIEPRWMHGKKAIVEPTRTLSATEVETRVCDYYRCSRIDHLQQHVS